MAKRGVGEKSEHDPFAGIIQIKFKGRMISASQPRTALRCVALRYNICLRDESSLAGICDKQASSLGRLAPAHHSLKVTWRAMIIIIEG